MNISFRRSSEESGILGAWCYTRQVGRRRSLPRVVQVQGIPRGTAAKAILESWCYTRRNGAVSIQAGGRSIPGSSRRCSLRLNSREAATSRSTPVGSRRRWCDLQSVVYTRVAWATAITKSNLVCFVYKRSIPDFVYNRSLPRFCLYQVITRFCL